ncbi:MAG: NYN domain-containing protein [bacterium JZ-2024 1]
MKKRALFIDYENVHFSLENEYGIEPDVEHLHRILEKIQEEGYPTIARCYADWEQFPELATVWKNLGVDPIFVPVKSLGKWGRHSNAVDLQLSVDWMETLWKIPEIEEFLLVSGDRDFLPILHKTLAQGKEVKVFTFRTSTGEILERVMKSRIYFLDEFLGLQRVEKPLVVSPGEGGISPDEVEWLILLLERQERRLPFVGFKFFRDQVLAPFFTLYSGWSFEESTEKVQALLQFAIDEGWITLYKVNNPMKPDFPTTALRLNQAHERVQKVLERFRPH